MYYSVLATVTNFDDKSKSQEFETIFNDSKKTPLENRESAIEKYKQLVYYYEKELPAAGQEFISPMEASIIGLKGQAYSLVLYFHLDEEADPCPIYGEDLDETLDALDEEAYRYKELEFIGSVKINDFNVLNHHLDFFRLP
ncbi:MAG TPA: hypothetical protein VKY37_02865 [Brumimicrobium sp.]|nr:hypothetical protein [Brumimicrobium sp.]